MLADVKELSITFGAQKDKLVSNPIRPEWILEGQPLARIELLSSSADGTASTYFWDCTAGRFNWFYGFDETFHILEGAVVLKDSTGRARRVTVGDTVFFPKGSAAEWTVDTYVRKLAFCRNPVPDSIVAVRDLVRRLKRIVRGKHAPEKTGLL
jgi:uncharacterized cupin superfamily protein